MARSDRNGSGLLVTGTGQLLTLASAKGPKRAAELRDVGAIDHGAVAAIDGRIVAVGSEAEARRALNGHATTVVDAHGGLVLPGFVDPHAHLVFVGQRADEFESRQLTRQSFIDFVHAGGGSMRTVRLTREAPEDELAALLELRLKRMLDHGTTTVEVKSGYGLTVAEELRHLEIVARVAESAEPRVVATALPAHFRPPEFEADPGPYLDQICSTFLPEVARRRLATTVDMFCEPGVYDRDQTRAVLSRARSLGLGVRLHAEQLSNSGGTQLAVELGAQSADHLGHASADDIEVLAKSSTVGVLIPGSYFLAPGEPEPKARAMIDAGVALALATDYNPGTSPIVSQALTTSLACVLFHLDAAEALAMVTINAAHAVGLGDEVGSLEVGKRADLIVIDATDYREIPYRFGENLVSSVIVDGRVRTEQPPVGPL